MSNTELSTSKYEEYKFLKKHTGGLATITDSKLAVIAENMVEVDRACHTAGRADTQTTNQLMTLTMLSDSPYRRLRQCLAEIEKKRSALDEAYFKMRLKQIEIKDWYAKGDERSVIKAQEAEHNIARQQDYIDGAFKEIAVFQAAYKEIREAHNIPEQWDERDAEREEITHHIRQAFRQAHRDMVAGGSIGLGNMEYLEQYGIHIQTATKLIGDYIHAENQQIAEGKAPTVNSLYGFLDHMVELFHEAHKDVLNRIGIKDLVKEEFLYLEETKNDNS